MIAYCQSSKFSVPAEESPLRCPLTSEPLEYKDLPPFDPAAIDPSQPGHWRYAAMLPVVRPGRQRITLGEGWTPLIPDHWAGVPVYWKLDSLMPSCSYKDRGVSVMVNWLLGLGATTVMDDSSGNAGASLACYAARAGLKARIYVPASAPEPKKTQISIYGAELVEVPGPRQAATEAVEAAQDSKSVYASHAWHPAYLLGQMTGAWEIWEQLGGNVPDWFIAPCGHGGITLGPWRGFQRLYEAGVTRKLPQLVAVQVEPFTPIHEAFHAHRDKVGSRNLRAAAKTMADGIAIERPVRSRSVLSALRRSGGTVIAVTDRELMDAQGKLAERGLFVEPTSAVVAAALRRLEPQIENNQTVVAVLTGHGLKTPPVI